MSYADLKSTVTVSPFLKTWSIRLLKGTLIFSIFAFLFVQAYRNDAFSQLWHQEKRWGFLLLAVLCNFLVVSITIVRWRWLVLAMEIPLSRWDAFRVGFVGYLFNLAPAGMVSGDLIKVVLLARSHPEMKEKATASVIVDRVIGLYIMFLTAAAAIWWTGFWKRTEPVAVLSTQVVLGFLIVSTVGAIFCPLPSMSRGRFRKFLATLPWGGAFLAKLVEAFQLYRQRPWTLFWSGLITFPVHIILALSIFLLADGLFTKVPTIMDVQVAHPVANLTTMIPLAAGPYEAVLNELFPLFLNPPLDTTTTEAASETERIGIGYGLIVALCYRLSCVAVAAVGMLFYCRFPFAFGKKDILDAVEEFVETESKIIAEKPNAAGSAEHGRP